MIVVTESPKGFLARLRLGKGARARFYIAARQKSDAEQRALRMQALSTALVRSGRLHEAKTILEAAAKQKTERAFAAIEARALQLANEVAPAVVAERPITFAEFAQLWTTGKLEERFPPTIVPAVCAEYQRNSRQRLAMLGKVLGTVPIGEVTKEQCNAALASLPRSLRGVSLGNYCIALRRLMQLAADCGYRESTPLPRGWGRVANEPREMAFLYPTEDATLCACASVEIGHRVLWGFLAREGLRKGEAFGLKWSELDLETGAIRSDFNKTSRGRRWVMEPGTVRALAWWKKHSKGAGRVFLPMNSYTASQLFRADLATAGIDRSELFEHNDRRHKIHVHDLRGTFVTLSLAAGRSEKWIMMRTGHRTSAMIQRYDRDVGLATELGFTKGLLPLDVALGLPGSPDGVGQGMGQGEPTQPNSAGTHDVVEVVCADLTAHEAPKTRGKRTRRDLGKHGGPPSEGGMGQITGSEDGPRTEADDMSDSVVEERLSKALERASEAGQWDVVAVLALELKERRVSGLKLRQPVREHLQ
jgi:hypothetical protein